VRVFLDTNVLLSGLFGTGLCARLLDTLVLTGHTLVIGEPVLAEFTRIARDKFEVPEDELTLALDWLRRHEVVGNPRPCLSWMSPIPTTVPSSPVPWLRRPPCSSPATRRCSTAVPSRACAL
jgi:predicted nucleic acid-binding protein